MILFIQGVNSLLESLDKVLQYPTVENMANVEPKLSALRFLFNPILAFPQPSTTSAGPTSTTVEKMSTKLNVSLNVVKELQQYRQASSTTTIMGDEEMSMIVEYHLYRLSILRVIKQLLLISFSADIPDEVVELALEYTREYVESGLIKRLLTLMDECKGNVLSLAIDNKLGSDVGEYAKKQELTIGRAHERLCVSVDPQEQVMGMRWYEERNLCARLLALLMWNHDLSMADIEIIIKHLQPMTEGDPCESIIVSGILSQSDIRLQDTQSLGKIRQLLVNGTFADAELKMGSLWLFDLLTNQTGDETQLKEGLQYCHQRLLLFCRLELQNKRLFDGLYNEKSDYLQEFQFQQLEKGILQLLKKQQLLLRQPAPVNELLLNVLIDLYQGRSAVALLKSKQRLIVKMIYNQQTQPQVRQLYLRWLRVMCNCQDASQLIFELMSGFTTAPNWEFLLGALDYYASQQQHQNLLISNEDVEMLKELIKLISELSRRLLIARVTFVDSFQTIPRLLGLINNKDLQEPIIEALIALTTISTTTFEQLSLQQLQQLWSFACSELFTGKHVFETLLLELVNHLLYPFSNSPENHIQLITYHNTQQVVNQLMQQTVKSPKSLKLVKTIVFSRQQLSIKFNRDLVHLLLSELTREKSLLSAQIIDELFNNQQEYFGTCRLVEEQLLINNCEQLKVLINYLITDCFDYSQEFPRLILRLIFQHLKHKSVVKQLTSSELVESIVFYLQQTPFNSSDDILNDFISNNYWIIVEFQSQIFECLLQLSQTLASALRLLFNAAQEFPAVVMPRLKYQLKITNLSFTNFELLNEQLKILSLVLKNNNNNASGDSFDFTTLIKLLIEQLKSIQLTSVGIIEEYYQPIDLQQLYLQLVQQQTQNIEDLLKRCEKRNQELRNKTLLVECIHNWSLVVQLNHAKLSNSALPIELLQILLTNIDRDLLDPPVSDALISTIVCLNNSECRELILKLLNKHHSLSRDSRSRLYNCLLLSPSPTSLSEQYNQTLFEKIANDAVSGNDGWQANAIVLLSTLLKGNQNLQRMLITGNYLQSLCQLQQRSDCVSIVREAIDCLLVEFLQATEDLQQLLSTKSLLSSSVENNKFFTVAFMTICKLSFDYQLPIQTKSDKSMLRADFIVADMNALNTESRLLLLNNSTDDDITAAMVEKFIGKLLESKPVTTDEQQTQTVEEIIRNLLLYSCKRRFQIDKQLLNRVLHRIGTEKKSLPFRQQMVEQCIYLIAQTDPDQDLSALINSVEFKSNFLQVLQRNKKVV